MMAPEHLEMIASVVGTEYESRTNIRQDEVMNGLNIGDDPLMRRVIQMLRERGVREDDLDDKKV